MPLKNAKQLPRVALGAWFTNQFSMNCKGRDYGLLLQGAGLQFRVQSSPVASKTQRTHFPRWIPGRDKAAC